MKVIRRRNRIDQYTAAELAIREAMLKVEAAGCDPLLTEAITLLDKAKERVADYVDREETRYGWAEKKLIEGIEWVRRDEAERNFDIFSEAKGE